MRARLALVVAALVAASACAPAASSPAAAPAPQVGAPPSGVRDATRESPPTAGESREWAFPKAKRQTLKSGTTLVVVESRALPIVELRAVVRAGAGFAAPGLAELTAELLRDGGTTSLTAQRLAERIEGLGTTLAIDVGFDATTFAMAVPAERAAAALRLLAEILEKPRFDDAELRRLRARKVDQAEEAVRSGSLPALRVAMRELVTGPYANVVATPAELSRIGTPSVRDFYKKFYGSKNVTLIVAGDVDAATTAVAETTFAQPYGGDVPKSESSIHKTLGGRRVFVCDRPKSVQSDVFVIGLAPERKASVWPALSVSTQVLGGGVASRLFTDLREKRGLAYSVRSQVVEVAAGPQPFAVYAGTQTAKTAETVTVLLEHLDRLSSAGVSREEAHSAARFLRDVFAVKIDSVGALADLVVESETLRLGDGYWDAYRSALAKVDERGASEAAKTFASKGAIIVVSGDASALADPLSRIGDVTVVNPLDDFKIVRSVSRK